jgi:hypothetical protein
MLGVKAGTVVDHDARPQVNEGVGKVQDTISESITFVQQSPWYICLSLDRICAVRLSLPIATDLRIK